MYHKIVHENTPTYLKDHLPHKIIMYHKIVHENTPTYLKDHLPHKIIMYHKIVHENTSTYLKDHLPPFVSATDPYHRRRRLQRQIPKP